jgi:hypothetical protein
MADNKGVFETGCAAGAIPTTSTTISNAGYNVASCLIPTYISVLPYDPSAAGAHYTSDTDYNTGYVIMKDAVTGRITVVAPSAELGESISVTR